MDYKQKYEKALNKAQKELQCCGNLDCDAARQIYRLFPELKKSEDERIKEEIINFLQLPHPQFVGKREHEKWVAWLENQGKKDSQVILPTFTFDDILALQCCMQAMSKNDELYKKLQSIHDRLHEVYGLEKQGEQKSAWSEEDGYQINTILHGLDLKREIYKKEGNKVEEERYNTQYNWLKSFKPNHWKPSTYDISLLEEIVIKIRNNIRPFCSEVSSLEALIDNLKNL